MKKFKMMKACLILTLILGVFILPGCGGGDSDQAQIGAGNTNITGATLTAIAITPANPIIANGLSKQFTATGTYTDGTSTDITALVSWSSATTMTATVNSSGLAAAIGTGTSVMTATSGSTSGSTTLTVSDATLSSIAITPANPSIAAGLTKQFTATGTYTDGTSQDITASVIWSSASESTATVNATSGLATGLTAGSSLITATFDSIAKSTTLTVSDATLSSIAVTPANPSIPKGLTKQFIATGIYSDGTAVDITSASFVVWSSATETSATVNAGSGLVTGIATGTSVISATSVDKSGSTTLTITAATLSSIAITPATPGVVDGLTKQLTATGTYSDGSLVNLTTTVTWSSATTAKATVNASGLATGVDAGTSVITATLGSISGITTLTVSAATLSSIAVTPANPIVVDGLTTQLTATGTYTDGSVVNLTATATWSSATTAKATVNASGLATGVDAGTSIIKATVGSIFGSTTLTVSAATLSSIVVTPANPSIVTGQTKQFTATGTYSDNSTANITTTVIWSSGDTLVATLNPNGQLTSGLATSLDVGTARITATLGLKSGFTILTVTAATLLPDNPDAPALGEIGRFVILASQAITTTNAPKSVIVNGDLGIMDQARSYYSGFVAGAAPGQLDELTNGLSYAHDDTDPALIPAPYASTIAFIDQSRTDLTSAYDFLSAGTNPAAATQVCPIELGNKTITRGVYQTANNVTIQTGSLTLDGEGDPNSVFIFNIGGTLTTDATAGSPAGNIILIGNAQAKNVYWRTAGTSIIGTNTIFYGNVFAGTQVNILTGASVTGRLFAVTDKVTLDANAVTKAP